MLGLLGSDFKHHLGPFLPGQHLDAVRRLLPLPAQAHAIPDCGIACADYVRDVIRYQTAGEIAAIIVEPIQGTAGNIIPPDGFLRAVQSIAQEHGALLIADEMITGFGRTGLDVGRRARRRGARHHDRRQGHRRRLPAEPASSRPTQLTAAKPWSNPSASSSSYGGNPLASAAGLAALEIILKEDLVENAERVGAVMLARAPGA